MANWKLVDKIRKNGAEAIMLWRCRRPYKILDLRGAYLSDTDLSDTDLSYAVLERADLRKANLSRANLSSAILHNADLRGAYLKRAYFCDQDVRNEHLTPEVVQSLHGANLAKAVFKYTLLADVNLSVAKGLEDAIHDGPSTVGLDTLFKSGTVPKVFLRGCGLPETLITYLPSLTAPNAIEFYSCFISYSHADKSFARRLHDALQDRGIRCWLDEHQMLPGDDIHEQVERAIGLWDKVLLCASESSLKESWWVDGEINRAFSKEQEIMKQRGKKVLALIPLNLDGYLFKWDSGKATEVKSRIAANFTGWDKDNSKFVDEFEKLVKALQLVRGSEPPPPPKL